MALACHQQDYDKWNEGIDMGQDRKELDDLLEFYNQWPDLRVKMVAVLDGSTLTPEQQSILRSMIHLVDCVGPADLQNAYPLPRSD